MKLTQTPRAKRSAGMTLLELTVVILVLLSLIAILFVGARAWKKGSDRSANIMNVRNVQQAVRGHANMHGLLVGAEVDSATVVFGSNGYLKEPTPPVTVEVEGTPVTKYEYLDEVPPIGEFYVTNADFSQNGDYWYTPEEQAEKTSDW
jgi:type II secretory pathway pseudopilin PulG